MYRASQKRESAIRESMSALSPQNPGVFAPAALGRIDHERASLECYARQAARHDGDFLAVVETVRAEIDVAPSHALRRRIVRRHYGERHDWLCDVVARLGDNFFAEGLNLGSGGARAHKHAVAAGFADALDD